MELAAIILGGFGVFLSVVAIYMSLQISSERQILKDEYFKPKEKTISNFSGPVKSLTPEREIEKKQVEEKEKLMSKMGNIKERNEM